MGNKVSSLNPSLKDDYPESTRSLSRSSSRNFHETDNGKFTWIENKSQPTILNESHVIIPANNAEEQERQQQLHYIIKYAFNKNIYAPFQLENGMSVLDVGCGAGCWLMEVATEHPGVQCTGIDIVPVFPQDIKPRNTTFELQDVTEKLKFRDNQFDIVNVRFMALQLRTSDWNGVVQELFRVTKKGGWIQLMEFGGDFHRLGPELEKFFQRTLFALKVRDLRMEYKDQDKLLRDQGFGDIKHNYISMPLGWGGPIGVMMVDNFVALLKGFKSTLAMSFGISEDEYEEWINRARIEMQSSESKGFWNLHYCVGRKL